MNPDLKQQFMVRWEQYFHHAELPVTFCYSDDPGDAVPAPARSGWGCIMADLARVRNGESLAFEARAIRCSGGKRYLGFSSELRPGFEFFLSCGNGIIEGERYVRTPEMVQQYLKQQPPMDVEGRYIIFKRWDRLTEDDRPEVVIFFATPDVLAGLFTLTNYDVATGDGVTTRFSSGCGSIVYHPFKHKDDEHPKAVLGMFDPSARPYVPADRLSFAVPMKKFERMVTYMDECFLITDAWKKVLKRIP